MKRTAFDASRDQRIANEGDRDSSLDCLADGCPNPASYYPGMLTLHEVRRRCGFCSAHAFTDPSHWPRITEEQQDALLARQSAPQKPKASPTYAMPKANRDALLQRMRIAFSGHPNPRAWAEKLRDRHRAGDNLTPAQITAYRTALGGAHGVDAPIEDDPYAPGGRYAA